MKRILEVDCFFCNNLSRPYLFGQNVVIKICNDCYNKSCKKQKLEHVVEDKKPT